MRTVTSLLKRNPEEGTLANGIWRIGRTLRVGTETERYSGLWECDIIRLVAFQQRLEIKLQTHSQL